MSGGTEQVLERWGRAVVRWRWLVTLAAVALVALGATWGVGVFDSLDGGGFADPESESSRASARITEELGRQEADLLVLYSSQLYTVRDTAFQDAVTDAVQRSKGMSEVAGVTSWYDADPASPEGATLASMVSHDGRATYAVVWLSAEDEDDKLAALDRLRGPLTAEGDVHTEIGGDVAFLAEVNEQTTEDIVRAETVSLPALLIMLIMVFGGLAAASIPLAVGGIAILGAFVATRLLAMGTDVSIFAINIITLIGMGMAIDYSLFIVSRYREELAAGREVADAIARTMATAGRTVMVSGMIVTLALASLLIFPQFFLRSLGTGGIAAVLIAVVAAVTVLPALLAILGERVNALRIPLPRLRPGVRPAERGQGSAEDCGVRQGGWARLAGSVMRRPVRYIIAVVTVLLLLATPFLRIELGGFDVRVLPKSSTARAVASQIEEGFPTGALAPVSVLVSGIGSAEAGEFVAAVGSLPTAVDAAVTASDENATLISVTYRGEPTGDTAADLVRDIRSLPAPEGAEVLVGGRTASDVDLLDSLLDHLPWMLLIIISEVLLLLFLAFGSVLLPLKAVVMNLVSMGASFGVVVWIFQDGHLADLLDFTSMGFIEPTSPILMLAVIFGLSTDYEVFLLSRVREEWDASRDNVASVAAGLQHTGGIITAAALLLIIVVAGFSTGGIMVIKLIGIGMIVAVLVDATLVRVLLVPATMRLLGRWNWWVPRWMSAPFTLRPRSLAE